MLEIDTISINKNVFNPNRDLMEQGIGIWDLTRSSVSFSFINLKIKNFYTLTEDAQMRPDLVAYQAYGDLKNTGSLMKINGVSNPFAIKTGTLFAIPVQERLDAAFDQKKNSIKSGNTTSNPNTSFRNEQENKAFQPSSSRKKFIEAQNKAKNPVSQSLPPNILQDGETQIIKSNSLIMFGPSVSNAGPNREGLPT
jgi:hypothetical protein